MSPGGNSFDTVVLGGGVMGLAIADALLARGRAVAVVEPFEIGHTRGSSHGDGRIFRLAYPERDYLELARLAGDGWRRLESRAGEPLLELTGNLDCGPAGGAEIAALASNLSSAGLAFELLSARQLPAVFPQLVLDQDQEAILQRDGGVLRADRVLAALAQQVTLGGGALLTGEAVAGIEPAAGGLALSLASGRRLGAETLVLAAGAWSRALGERLGLELPLTIRREQVAYFASTASGGSHRIGKLPTVIEWGHPSRLFYALPEVRVPGAKLGWHQAGVSIATPEEPSALDAANLEAVRGFARRRLPGLAAEPFEVSTCLYTNTPDRDFLLDRHPRLPAIVLAAGFSGHGFKFAPAVGAVTAALVLGEKPPLPLDRFRLGRFG